MLRHRINYRFYQYCHRPVSSLNQQLSKSTGHFTHLDSSKKIHFIQCRGKKTTTTVRLADLPQGPIQVQSPPKAVEEEDENVPSYPTVVLQARRNMDKFDNCVLLTRVGGFYELYFEHAEEYGPLLNLKVASKKTSAGPVPMVSFFLLPYYRFECTTSNKKRKTKTGWLPFLSIG